MTSVATSATEMNIVNKSYAMLKQLVNFEVMVQLGAESARTPGEL